MVHKTKRLKDLETIYYIFDSGDTGYEGWFGTQEDIIDYLKEEIPANFGKKFKGTDSWVEGLEKMGLTFKMIN